MRRHRDHLSLGVTLSGVAFDLRLVEQPKLRIADLLRAAGEALCEQLADARLQLADGLVTGRQARVALRTSAS